MNTQIPQRKRLNGFSLVELAIVLLITTIILSAGLSLLTVKREASQREATQKKQEAIKQALISYLGQHKRLPCPAIMITGVEDRTGTPCKQYSGIVPYQELGLDQAAALDGWENFITYVVSPNIIPPPPVSPAQQPAPAPLLTTAWLYTYSSTPGTAPCSTNICTSTLTLPNPGPIVSSSNLAFWPSTSTGGITVNDGTTNIADPTKATGAVVTLISYGKNGYGALNIKGGINDSSVAGTNEVSNISPASGVPSVFKRDTTDSPIAVGGPFDDIVMILSANDLTGPLIANGTMQSSAQAALSQANDAVIGNILASRSCSSTPMCTSTSTPGSVCTTWTPGPTVCGDDPACTYQIPGPLVCLTTTPGVSTCTSTSYTNACAYSIPAPASITFTNLPNVAAWGVSYSQVATTIYATTYLPITATNAYTLTAGDGSTKKVSIQELQGILSRSAGFN